MTPNWTPNLGLARMLSECYNANEDMPQYGSVAMRRFVRRGVNWYEMYRKIGLEEKWGRFVEVGAGRDDIEDLPQGPAMEEPQDEAQDFGDEQMHDWTEDLQRSMDEASAEAQFRA